MGFTLLTPDEAHWRPSNLMKTPNTDLGRQLGCSELGLRLWRLSPGQASTRHRHRVTEEVYVVLEGTGRLRVDDELLTLPPFSAVRVDPASVRQPFNDTESDQLWLIVGAPNEAANTAEFTDEQFRFHYPDGPRAMPPELGGTPDEA